MLQYFRKLVLGITAISAVVVINSPASAEPLRVKLDWTPWGVHAAIHLAQQKGWYKAAGLDVETEDGNGSVTTVQVVGNSGQFDVGHAALASMMIARDKGLPVKAVAVFARLSDIGMLVPKGSGITGPKDLRGKKVAYTAGSLEAPFIDSFLAAGGLKRAEVELINVDAASKASTYAVGRADAAFSSLPFFLPVVSAQRPSEGVRFSDYNLNMPSFGFFATEAKLATRKEEISKFASITAQAWAYVFAGHQDEAVDSIVAQRPQARLDRKILRGQIDALQGFFQSANSKGVPIGAMVPRDWEEAATTLAKGNLVGSAAKAVTFYEAGLVREMPAVK